MAVRSISVVVVALGAALAAAPASHAADVEAGRLVFERSCAACHGAAGRPDPDSPVVKALNPPSADLSDPLFNSREPAADWELVVGHGGASLGLSAAMSAQGGALSERDIENVVTYVKTLAPGSERYPPGELNLMLPIRTRKAFPEDEVVFKSRWTEGPGEDAYRAVVEFEKRVGARGQAIVEIPFDHAAGEDSVKLSMLPQIRIGLTRGGHVALDLGVEVPLSDQNYDWCGRAVLPLPRIIASLFTLSYTLSHF